MNHWLIKTEPGAWSWDDQTSAPNATTQWDGVRNHQAANHLKAMNVGDRALFYHSANEKRIVGIVEVVKAYHPDPSDDSGRFGMVEVKAVEPLPEPVTLAQIKADDRLRDLPLVRQSRLSVMPIDPKSWKLIRQMAGLK